MIENMQAHLVGRNIIKLRVSPLVSFPNISCQNGKRHSGGDSQFNKRNLERER